MTLLNLRISKGKKSMKWNVDCFSMANRVQNPMEEQKSAAKGGVLPHRHRTHRQHPHPRFMDLPQCFGDIWAAESKLKCPPAHFRYRIWSYAHFPLLHLDFIPLCLLPEQKTVRKTVGNDAKYIFKLFQFQKPEKHAASLRPGDDLHFYSGLLFSLAGNRATSTRYMGFLDALGRLGACGTRHSVSANVPRKVQTFRDYFLSIYGHRTVSTDPYSRNTLPIFFNNLS